MTPIVSSRVAFFYPGDITGRDLDHVSGAGRTVNLAQAAAAAGYDVRLFGLTAGPPRDTDLGGLPCHLLAGPGRGRLRRFVGGGAGVVRRLGPFLDADGVSTLVLYGTTLAYAAPLAAYAGRHGIRLVASVNEWGHRGAQGAASYALLRAGVAFVRARFDGVIAISALMRDYFGLRAGLEVVTIPSIFDPAELPVPTADPGRPDGQRGAIVLAYAGAVRQGKDATNNVLRGLSLLVPEERARFRFLLCGSTREQIVASLGDDAAPVLAATEPLLDFRGFLPRAELRPLLAAADYSVLLRPAEPYANAGFPTKFGEAMLLGVPVIANLTSDLGEYLVDGENGWVVPDETPAAVAATLRRVLAAHAYPNAAMRAAAAAAGRRAFDYHGYVDAMRLVLG